MGPNQRKRRRSHFDDAFTRQRHEEARTRGHRQRVFRFGAAAASFDDSVCCHKGKETSR